MTNDKILNRQDSKEVAVESSANPGKQKDTGEKRKRRDNDASSLQESTGEAECFSSARQQKRSQEVVEEVKASPRARRQKFGSSGPEPHHSEKRAQDTNGPDGHDPLHFEEIDPVGHWVEHRYWPKYAEPDETVPNAVIKLGKRAPHASIPDESWHSPNANDRKMAKALRPTLFDSAYGPSQRSLALCGKLQESKQTVPSPSLFEDPAFHLIRERLRDRNEAKVVTAIGSLLVPQAEYLYAMGESSLRTLYDTVDELWTKSASPFNVSPKPDYAVGFRDTAFTKTQIESLEALEPSEDCSFFRATEDLFFPFFTAEAKSHQ
ncbi:hypothetical protein HDK90DRAFT_499780 [Phyllosticta capitalensis]|uniref:DUF7924 domain-containing protein n=1 Tax=Phyllosticta capitalensis TaxID=121624 RepID=A0ABR1Y9Y5_9PEZI